MQEGMWGILKAICCAVLYPQGGRSVTLCFTVKGKKQIVQSANEGKKSSHSRFADIKITPKTTFFFAFYLVISNKKTNFAADSKTQCIMDVATMPQRHIQISIPARDYSFIRTLSQKMGWTIQPQRKSGLQKAVEDVRAGRVYEASSVDDLMAQLEA